MPKRCLVIGASGAIGSATTNRLIDQGYAVGVHYRSNSDIINKWKETVPNDQFLGAYQADLSTEEGIEDFLHHVDSDWDALVFCGGQAWTGLFQEMVLDEMNALFYVHVQSVWRITHKVLPKMIEKKRGHVIVVSSIFGEEGASTEVVYSSVKGAQISFVKGLAKEVGPSGIYVNAVTPGLIDSQMNRHLDDSEREMLEEDIPLGRAGDPAEVADAIEFLLSKRSSYITGQTIKVNGGWS
ncbi:SDR family oxidoreductase [Halobacillus locisalis]|uniref:SDR family oxidoreductase n=1 Tax=Halobacillus locisalis TaxID=220753 RepID=A0A838CQ06_9BACI|nr:SDR family oxidoreductase [Halobacillus locisalis]MBA2174044.1 SDR family oxidoreductase [Halobacillus locisalis]